MSRTAVSLSAFACAIAVDVATKAYAVGHAAGPDAILYNHRPGNLFVRLWVSALTVLAVYVLEQLGRRRGLGPLWAAWAAVGVLAGGTLSNGVSSLLWRNGVPDFIHLSGGWVWNVADFEIVFGLLGTAAAIVLTAVLAYVRGLRVVSRA
jgi:signal peptidase (SPase) II